MRDVEISRLFVSGRKDKPIAGPGAATTRKPRAFDDGLWAAHTLLLSRPRLRYSVFLKSRGQIRGRRFAVQRRALTAIITPGGIDWPRAFAGDDEMRSTTRRCPFTCTYRHRAAAAAGRRRSHSHSLTRMRAPQICGGRPLSSPRGFVGVPSALQR